MNVYTIFYLRCLTQNECFRENEFIRYINYSYPIGLIRDMFGHLIQMNVISAFDEYGNSIDNQELINLDLCNFTLNQGVNTEEIKNDFNYLTYSDILMLLKLNLSYEYQFILSVNDTENFEYYNNREFLDNISLVADSIELHKMVSKSLLNPNMIYEIKDGINELEGIIYTSIVDEVSDVECLFSLLSLSIPYNDYLSKAHDTEQELEYY